MSQEYGYQIVYGAGLPPVILVRFHETGPGKLSWRRDIFPAIRRMIQRDYNVPLCTRRRNGMPGEQQWWLDGGPDDIAGLWEHKTKHVYYDYVAGEFQKITV